MSIPPFCLNCFSFCPPLHPFLLAPGNMAPSKRGDLAVQGQGNVLSVRGRVVEDSMQSGAQGGRRLRWVW